MCREYAVDWGRGHPGRIVIPTNVVTADHKMSDALAKALSFTKCRIPEQPVIHFGGFKRARTREPLHADRVRYFFHLPRGDLPLKLRHAPRASEDVIAILSRCDEIARLDLPLKIYSCAAPLFRARVSNHAKKNNWPELTRPGGHCRCR